MCLTYRIILTAQSEEREKLETRKSGHSAEQAKAPRVTVSLGEVVMLVSGTENRQYIN